MFIASTVGRRDAGVQGGSGLFGASGLGQELAKLKIPGDVFGMRGQESLEVLVRAGCIARIGAFHRQAVAGEGIGGLGSDEILENLAARFLLWLGRGHAHSIFALEPNAKFPKGREPTNEINFTCDEGEN